MRLGSVNQDKGIRPGGAKGASVHLQCMREAFGKSGAEVLEIDEKDGEAVDARLRTLHAEAPLQAVYERYALGGVAGSRFCAEHGLPHVLEVNAPLMDEAALHRDFQITDEAVALETAIFGGAHRVLAVSEGVAQSVLVRGVDPERVWVRPNGVDTERFLPHGRTGSNGAPFVLGFHGRLRPWHAFDRLVEVVVRLLDRGHDVRLELVGKGDYAEHLRGRVPDDRWSHAEWMDHHEVAEFVARYDALALTYSPDAPCYFSPLKLLEAMAVGAVPVVPRLGDLERVVQHEVNGLLYPAGDIDALVAGLERVITDLPLRARLSQGAVAMAGQHSWNAMAQEILDDLSRTATSP
jgi:glycosyltransferase involved in cell wall biosynthesis